MSETWKHLATVVDGERYELNGLNIWDYSWISSGTSVLVKDPLYNQEHMMRVYELTNGTSIVRFAAGEFSNCVWGIYQE